MTKCITQDKYALEYWAVSNNKKELRNEDLPDRQIVYKQQLTNSNKVKNSELKSRSPVTMLLRLYQSSCVAKSSVTDLKDTPGIKNGRITVSKNPVLSAYVNYGTRSAEITAAALYGGHSQETH